jgi:hypothetical protein
MLYSLKYVFVLIVYYVILINIILTFNLIAKWGPHLVVIPLYPYLLYKSKNIIISERIYSFLFFSVLSYISALVSFLLSYNYLGGFDYYFSRITLFILLINLPIFLFSFKLNDSKIQVWKIVFKYLIYFSLFLLIGYFFIIIALKECLLLSFAYFQIITFFAGGFKGNEYEKT